MGTASIEFLVPGSEPVVFEFAPAVVYVLENLLLTDDVARGGWFAIRVEGCGLVRLPRDVPFRTVYPELSATDPFDADLLREVFPALSKGWEQGMLEFRRDCSVAPLPLIVAGVKTWESYLEVVHQSRGF